MKTGIKRLLLLLVSLIALGAGVWSTSRVVAQGGGMDDMMKMMKQKMMSSPASMKAADKAVQEQKEKAIKAGTYHCCLKHPCDFCAMKMGECPCGTNVAMDKPNCNECKGGWYAGDGAIPGKTADQIMTLPRPLPM